MSRSRRHDKDQRNKDQHNKDRARRRTRPTMESAPSPHDTGGEPDEPQDQALIQQVRYVLESREPLALLDLVSAMVSPVDPRRRNPLEPQDADAATFEQLVESFLEISTPETSTLLAVIGATTQDELLAGRVRRELVARRHPVPAWLRNLDFDVYRVEEMTEALGDGDDVILGVRLPSGHEFTLLVYIDHNVGTLVKDAFSIDRPIASVLDTMQSNLMTSDQVVAPLDPADARTRIEDAIAMGAMTIPPFESETWPACRPLVEWVVRTLPAGGQGYERPEWSERELEDLTDDFFASEHGRSIDSPDARDLLGSILWFGTDYGPGDPLRWSPVSVEILLGDWIPRKIEADADYLARAPELLRGFIRFCHSRRKIRAERTTETLQAVDRWEPGYQEAIRSPRRQGPMALLQRIGALGPLDEDGLEEYDDEDLDFPEFMLDALSRAVGGRIQLDALGTQPLPDEDFAWAGVAEDIRARVDDVLRRCDAFCEAHMGVEFRTACRRFLADVAGGDPVIFRRKGSASRAAAAVCWVLGKANREVGHLGGMEVQEMLAAFGVQGSVSQRAEVMQQAIGVDPHHQYGGMDLASSRYLTSSRRAEIVRDRDRYRAMVG